MTPVAVAGLGVIGGSLAKALTGAGVNVRAFSPSRSERERARGDGIVVVDTLDGALVRGASAVIIAVPLDRIASVARELRAHLPSDGIMMHTGSLQGFAALGIAPAGENGLIGTHPMAGNEGSGYESARADLFAGSTISVDTVATAAQRVQIEELWTSVGASRFEYRDRDEHDHLMSWVSHLPQLASSAMALTLARAGIPATDGGSGLRDVTRLASSSLLMWRPLLDAAPVGTVQAIAALEAALADMRAALDDGDQELLSEMWTAARAWRTAKEMPGAS